MSIRLDFLDCSAGFLLPRRARSRSLDFPTTHRIPLTWLIQNGGPSLKYRTLTELAPEGTFEQQALIECLTELVQSAQVSAITTRQEDTGLWGGNFLAYQPSEKEGIEEVGTVAQYRRLLQLGVPTSTRPFRQADRVMFRSLSRDEDPLLNGEFADAIDEDPETFEPYRNLIREGVCAALAEAGKEDDPRLRGAAHKTMSAVSSFLRSPLSADPFIKKSGSWQLHPDATPPSWLSLATLSAMPSLQRERAGFVDRLCQYLAQPVESRSFSVAVGKRTHRPPYLLFGDPIELDPKAKGLPKDIPLALHYIELLAGMGMPQLLTAPNATAGFARLLEDLDADGVWHPKNLRSQPKPSTPLTYHCWPISPDDGELASRQADITFRLARIAKQLGWRLEYS